MQIAIVDYGVGNLRSVENAFRSLGYDATVVDDPARLEEAERVVLPGVGAFGDGMNALRGRGFVEPLGEAVRVQKKPFLGICLGMQFLATKGYEHGEHDGLGWIAGKCVRLPEESDLRVPHIGWNSVARKNATPLLDKIADVADFYFVHSYVIVPEDESVVTGTCDYGGPFVATVQQDNVFGAQFHPEKSHKTGLQLLRNFCEWKP